MKILQKIAFGSDWGHFVYFSGDAGSEQFNWNKEVKNVSDEQQVDRDTFYAKLGKDKQDLKKEVESCGCPEKQTMLFDNRLLSIQLAEFFGELEVGNEKGIHWNVASHKKTFDVLNRLTKFGYNVDKPSEFRGLAMVILKDGTLKIEGKGTKTDIVIPKKEVKEKKTEKEETKVNTLTEKDKKPITEKIYFENNNGKVLGGEVISKKKDVVKNEIGTGANKVETKIDSEEKTENLTTKIIGKDFLIENTTTDEERSKIESKMAEIKKTPEEIQVLQERLNKLDQDFSQAKADIQKALEGHFEKGKLKDKTPAQMEDLIKDNKNYTELYAGLKSHFEFCRTLEIIRKKLVATIAVDALYNKEVGYESRYDIEEEDVLDVSEKKKTDFRKRYDLAEKSLQGLGGGSVDNQFLFDEMKEGYERARLVVQAKRGMDELADLNTPVATDFPKIQEIKSQITEARTHGTVNDMIREDALILLLQKERRSSHMQAKENAEKAYKDFPEKYKGEKRYELTEKELSKDAKGVSSLISILGTAMTHPLNKEKDPESVKKEGETWDTKYIEQNTVEDIEGLILRRDQLEQSGACAVDFRLLITANDKLLGKERHQGKDKTWLSIEEVEAFQKLETKLNTLLTPYGDNSRLLQKDLERQYGDSFAKDLARARENIGLRLNQPDMKNHETVKQKIIIQDGILKFEKLLPKKEKLSALELEEKRIQKLIFSSPTILKEGKSVGLTPEMEPFRSERIEDKVTLMVNGRMYEYRITGKEEDLVLEKVRIKDSNIEIK